MTDTVQPRVSFASMFATDQNAEENGKWFEDILGDGSNINIKLRRMTSKTVERARQRISLENRKHLVKGKFPEEIDQKLLYDLLADAVVVDWSGINDNDEQEVPYSRDTVFEYVKAFPDFRRIIVGLSTEMAAFRAESATEIEKN